VRDQVATLRDGMVRNWLGPVQQEVELLRQSAASLDGGSVEERQRAFEARASEIRGKARAIASRSNALGKSTAAEMRALAATVDVAPGKPGFACHDPTLAQRLVAAAAQAEQPAELKLREAVFNEGPAGVANAVKNLWRNIGSYGSSLLSYLFTGSASGRTADGEPITGRDLIALLAAIGIDLGLFALAALNPPATAPVRSWGAQTQAELQLPTREIVNLLRRAIETAVARAPGTDTNLEWVRQHFIHHDGAAYFVIPNLYGVAKGENGVGDEELKALAMNQLAGVFDDLKLIRALTKDELQRIGNEEMRASYSDLQRYRARWKASQGRGASNDDGGGSSGGWMRRLGLDRAPLPSVDPASGFKLTRNHGLFSKAERALAIARWSEEAQHDLEIFRLLDTEGLTPILMVLHDIPPGEIAAEEAFRTERRGGALNENNPQRQIGHSG
jgi:hypothetical protein